MHFAKIAMFLFVLAIFLDCLIGHALFAEQIQSEVASQCTTPNRDLGLCVEIRKCAIFMEALASGKNSSFDFIRNSRCDSNSELSTQPMVCCGIHDDYLKQVPCVTPNEDEGMCVEIRNCSVFMNAIISDKNQSFDFIRESRCDLNNELSEQPKVCCGKHADYVNKTIDHIPCVTPNNDEGVCVEIRNCSVFVDALISGKNESFDFIRQSRCVSDNELDVQPKVCCGNHAVYLSRKAKCVTPNQDEGECVDIRKCSIFMGSIALGSEESFDFIRQSQCDLNQDHGQPKVCCGTYADYLNKSSNSEKSVRTCVTPNQDVGVCVEIKKCTIFMDALESKKEESYDFIRESRCDSQAEQLMVCCGKYNHYLTKPKEAKNDKHQKKININPFNNNCGNQTVDIPTRIFGGTDARLQEFPWIARLRYRNDEGRFIYGCTGFLVSEQFVLTAAHCINSKLAKRIGFLYDVRLGEYNTEKEIDCIEFTEGRVCADPPQNIRIAKPIVHQKFTDNIEQHNDIAIIPLEKPALLTTYVYPICLSTKLSSHMEMWISGWGKTETKEENPIKLKTSVQRADKLDCIELYKTGGATILNSQLCAGGKDRHDSCKGDSGGPIMVQTGTGPWYAEGIVSVGNKCGTEGWPAIYTSIPNYMSWIKKEINRYLQKEEEQPGRTCITPNGESAQCVSIYQCPILYKAMTNQSREVKKFLRQSQCNYDIEPYVCCGSVGEFQTTITSHIAVPKADDIMGNGEFICGLQMRDTDRILGGAPTLYTEFPWMALLKYQKRSGEIAFPCGGALVSKKYVLTAAHCVIEETVNKIGTLIGVRLGEWDLTKENDCENKFGLDNYCDDEPALDVGIEDIIIHSGYDDRTINRYHDIALLRLDKEVKFTTTIAPICLPTISERPSSGEKLWVAGWGRTENGSLSPVKLKVELPLVANNECANTFKNASVTVLNTQLCAGGELNKDSCKGDSGGPLMYETNTELKQWTIEGVVSFGAKCGTENWPGIYTRVSKYLEWIEYHVWP